MPVVEVPCPNCGAKLKAPDNMAGKKAKCRKCTKTFRLPGAPVADSADAADVPVADLIEASPPPPAKPAAPMPSANPFDFSDQPDPPKPAPAKPQAAPAKPAATPAPTKPVAPSKPQATPAPAKPQAAAPAKPTTKPDTPKVAEPPPAPPPPPEPAPAANPFAFDAPDVAPADPFAFDSEPAPSTKGKAKEKAKSKPRAEVEPPPKGRDEEENEVAPRKKVKPRDEDEDEDERPAKGKAKAKAGGEEPYNPFANYSAAPGPTTEPEVTWNKPPRAEGEDEDESEKPRYRRPDELPDTTRKTLFFTGAIGAIALALGIIALVVYIKANRPPPDPEVKKDDKKDEPPPVPPDQPKGDGPKVDPKVDPKGKDKVDPPKIDPKGKDKVDPKVDPPKVDPKVDPKMNSKVDPPKVDPPKVDPVRPKDPGPTRGRTINAVQGVRPFTVGPLPVKPELAEKPRIQLALGVPVPSVKRVFPRLSKDTDTGVLVRTGAGERLAIESYGAVGNLVPGARIEYDGDGATDPIADMYAPAETGRFLAAVGGKLHVWTLADRKKLADGLDPYADKPDHAKAGLAAAFLTPDPNQVVTVSTAGAVHLYDLRDRKAVSEFIPPHGAPGRVALGLSVAKADGNGSIILALGGIIYQLEAKPGLRELRKFDFGGDVNRSLGLAVSGTPGRILYAFETAADKSGKTDKLVMGLSLGNMARPVFCQMPADLGEPKGALWANTDFGGVVVEKGVLWFDDHENRFHPLALTQPPAPGLYAGDEYYFWYVAPSANDATKSMVVAISAPPDGKFQANFPMQPLPSYRIDATGLSR